MSKMSDNYPVGMTICDEYGLSGRCGIECPLFEDFECPEFSMAKNFKERVNRMFSKEESKKLLE